jgi:hypothetical protein
MGAGRGVLRHRPDECSRGASKPRYRTRVGGVQWLARGNPLFMWIHGTPTVLDFVGTALGGAVYGL